MADEEKWWSKIPGWVLPGGIGAVTSILGGLFGKKKQTSSYQMSPEERSIYNQLWSQYQGDVPSSVTDPFNEARQGLEQDYARQPGASGILGSMRMKVAGKESEAIKQYKQSLLGPLASIAGGRGAQTTTQPTDWGETIGGMGEDFGLLWGLYQMMGGNK